MPAEAAKPFFFICSRLFVDRPPDPRKTHNQKQAQTVERNARRVTGSQPAFPSPRRRRFPSWFPPELRNATQRLIR